MARMIDFLPELEDEEAVHVSKLMLPMEGGEAKQFSRIYRARRKDPQTILLTAILGFFLAAGIHRFILGQIGMGVLYLLTGGFVSLVLSWIW